MKKLMCLLLVFANLPLCAFDIVPYEPAHKDAIMEIAFQDPQLFFCGGALVASGAISAEQFEKSNRDGMDHYFGNPLYVKLVLIDSGKVVGFAFFFRTKEQSLEDVKALIAAQGVPAGVPFPSDEQLLSAMPWLKPAAACESFVELEALAVDRTARHRGFGRALMHAVSVQVSLRWPTLRQIQLNVNADNVNARKLYESEGFVPSACQQKVAMIGAVQYEKVL